MIPLYFYMISISIVGYGYFISKILNIKFEDIGILGILGISFLAIISYSTSLFLKHDYFFNTIVIFIGTLFFLFGLREFWSLKRKLVIFFVVFSILIIFIFVSKNHDDFPYYHFPYMILLTEYSHPIGLGQLNNGFNSPSSIFFISSMFYLPGIKYYSFHFTPALIMGFSNLILINFIFDKNIFDKNKLINFLSLISLIFINIFFYRLAEHGTDRSGMILIIITVIYFLYLSNNFNEVKDYENKNIIKIISILIFFVISIKPYYLIYIPLLFLLLLFNHTKYIFLKLFFKRTFYYCFVFIFFTVMFTFLNSSCLIFPLSSTCFENLAWSINKSDIQNVKIWFELWSKGGANPHFIVDDRVGYIKGLNWLSNWINIYFFNKGSDFLIGVIFLTLLFFSIFYKKEKLHNSKKKKIIFLYSLLVIFFLEWFLKHPSLRYGGYHLVALLFFIPVCFILEKMKIDFNFFLKRTFILLFITFLVFTGRNIKRLNDENLQYRYNPIVDSRFKFIDGKKTYFRYNETMKNYSPNYKTINILGKEFKIID